MANIFEIPLLNPLRPTLQTGKVAADSGTIKYYAYQKHFNTRGFDTDFYSYSRRFYEDKQKYILPYQQSDTIRLQWFSSDATHTNFTAQLLDEKGNVYSYKTITVTEDASLWNGLSLYSIYIDLFDIPEGIWFVRLRYNHGSTTYSYVLFEPIDVKQIHSNTIRIDYSNSYNDQSIVYTSDLYVNQIRVKGSIIDVMTESKFSVYENQPLDTEMVSGIAYRVHTLQIGNNIGIPEWLADKIERVFLCDTLYIDGCKYSRAEGAKLEPNKTQGKRLSTYNIKLRDADNNTTSNYAMKHKELGTMPQTNWIWVEFITIAGTVYNIDLAFKGKRNLLDYLNSVTLRTMNSGGAFDGCYFTESIDEKLIFVGTSDTTISSTWTFTNYYQYSFVFYVTSGHFELDIVAPAAQAYAISWGDGNVDDSAALTTGTTTISHTFSGNNIKECVVFVSDCYSIADMGNCDYMVEAIGGDFPPLLEVYDMSFTNLGIKSLVNNPFKYVTALDFFDVRNNEIYTYHIDQIIMWIYDEINNFDSGADVSLQDQAVIANPSSSVGMQNFINTINANIGTFTTD